MPRHPSQPTCCRRPGIEPNCLRFVVVYQMTNLDQEARLRVKAYVNEDEPVVPTASKVWLAANWAEREVYDMYGIEFEGHPNLIRILMPQEFSGFPLRKDYAKEKRQPLVGPGSEGRTGDEK